jgi:succinate-semialdehyde dehydrogenase/glutarate-semialdehyde dehydrogenase
LQFFVLQGRRAETKIIFKGSVVGKHLILTPLIDAVSFTGSTEVGIEVAKDSASYLHRIFLELGGNDSLIIYDDVCRYSYQ